MTRRRIPERQFNALVPCLFFRLPHTVTVAARAIPLMSLSCRLCKLVLVLPHGKHTHPRAECKSSV